MDKFVGKEDMTIGWWIGISLLLILFLMAIGACWFGVIEWIGIIPVALLVSLGILSICDKEVGEHG